MGYAPGLIAGHGVQLNRVDAVKNAPFHLRGFGFQLGDQRLHPGTAGVCGILLAATGEAACAL